MTDFIAASLDNQVLSLSFNRPERKNAITLAMYTALAEALNQAANNPEVRVVLLSGAGGNFTSGNDLGDFLSAGPVDDSHPVVHFIKALLAFPKPVVAAVNGVAIGIGTTLLLQCDLVYADASAKFQMPFVNLGLVPEFASSLLVPRLAGQVAAAELLLLGESFDAAKAQSLGFINGVEGDVLAHARAQAQRLANQPPAAVRKTKALLRAPMREAIESVMKSEFGQFAELLAGGEFKEAATAFFEKRKPDFSRFD